MTQLDLFKLFWEAGLAVSLSFILGLAVGLFTMSYLNRQPKKKKEKHEVRTGS